MALALEHTPEFEKPKGYKPVEFNVDVIERIFKAIPAYACNVYVWAKGKIGLYYKAENKTGEAGNILFFRETEHFVVISNLQSLMPRKSYSDKMCDICFSKYRDEHLCADKGPNLESAIIRKGKHKGERRKPFEQFRNWSHQQLAPFFVVLTRTSGFYYTEYGTPKSVSFDTPGAALDFLQECVEDIINVPKFRGDPNVTAKQRADVNSPHIPSAHCGKKEKGHAHHNHYKSYDYVCKLCVRCNMTVFREQRTLPVLMPTLGGDDAGFALKICSLAKERGYRTGLLPRGTDSFVSMTCSTRCTTTSKGACCPENCTKGHPAKCSRVVSFRLQQLYTVEHKECNCKECMLPVVRMSAEDLARQHLTNRERIKKTSGLDPTYALTKPSFYWGVFLFKTKEKLRYFVQGEEEMHEMWQAPGGFCSGSIVRHAGDKKTILHFDENSSYPNQLRWCSSGNYRMVDAETFDPMAHDPYGHTGYRIVADVEPMPSEHHDEYKDFCPLTHVRDGLIVGDLGSATITADLSTIQFLLQHHHGVKVKKVQAFSQSNFLADYIDTIAGRRADLDRLKSLEDDPLKRATYDADMQDCKDAVNFVTGYCIGKVNEYVKASICHTDEDEQRAVRDCSRQNGRGWSFFGDVCVAYTRSNMKDRKPRPPGVIVRERGLVGLKSFFYKVLRPAFPGCRLVYTDTDSLFVLIDGEFSTENLDTALIDLSGFPRDHPLFNEANRKKPGYFYLNPRPIKEMRVHGAKRYEIIYEDEHVIKNSGIAQHVQPTAEQTAAVAARIDRERKDPKLHWTGTEYVPFGFVRRA